MIGKTILHYKIIEELGKGGMGVVYKAEDTKLERTVALKFLPATSLGTDDEKLRFVQEAKSAAKLSHSNIATVYEINEDPDSGDTFISMEFLEGETLEEKVKKSPLKIKDAMKIAKQIAEGLATAHEQGVVHRDIKSANIMITPKGVAKIMDFGLAKVTAGSMMTQVGTVLGTIGYMSPEQSRGDVVDHRTDIWSLGVILFEMISGQLPFKGEYHSAIVYSIMNVEPEPITGLRSGVPMDLEKIISKLLAKEPDERYQNIIELPVDLKNVDLKSVGTSAMGSSIISESLVKEKEVSFKFKYSNQTLIAFAAGAFIFSGLTWFLKGTNSNENTMSFKYKIFKEKYDDESSPNVISPDGSKVLHKTDSDLYLRDIDEISGDFLEGTEGATDYIFSPDGKSIAYWTGINLKTLSIDRGKPNILVTSADIFPGGSWSLDNYIYYTPHITDGIYRISSSGGSSEKLTSPDDKNGEFIHWLPYVLPDNKHVIFTIWNGGANPSKIALLNIETKESTIIIENGSHAQYVPTGHIIYSVKGTLIANTFDIKTMKVGLESVPVINNIYENNDRIINLSFSNNGILMYNEGNLTNKNEEIYIQNEIGVVSKLQIPEGDFSGITSSPNAKYLAISRKLDNEDNIWIYDFAKENLRQITSDGLSINPEWHPNDNSITYMTWKDGPFDLYQLSVLGNQADNIPLAIEKLDETSGTWSPDGQIFMFSRTTLQSGNNLMFITKSNPDSVQNYLVGTYDENNPRFSYDGTFLAYSSNEFGEMEIFVKKFDDPGKGVQVSIEGANFPRWSKTENKLYYDNYDKLYSSKITYLKEVKFTKPEVVLTNRFPENDYGSDNPFDILKDGSIVFRKKGDETYIKQVVVHNWFAELKRLVPTNKN